MTDPLKPAHPGGGGKPPADEMRIPSGVHRVELPLQHLPFEERVAEIKKRGADATARFEQLSRELDDRLSKVDPVHVLALAGLTLVVGKGETVKQHDVELIAGMLLRYPPEHYKALIGDPKQVQACLDLAKELTALYLLMPFAEMAEGAEAKGEPDEQLGVIQEIRSYTQVMRGDFYLEQIKRLFRPALVNVDAAFKKNYGIEASLFLDALLALSLRVEDRLNHHVRALGSFFMANGVENICRAYAESFPSTKPMDPKEITQLMKEKGLDELGLKYMMFAHSDLRAPDIFRITEEDLVAVLPPGVSQPALEAALDAASCSFGEAEHIPIAFLRLDNPIWSKPFIRLGERDWFWPTPTTLVSYAVRVFEQLCDANDKLKVAYEDAKATALERAIADIFREVHPNAKIWTGVTWKGSDGALYETDILAEIDGWIFIAEGKSGKITDSARRGSLDRIKREAKKLLTDPAWQSERLARLLAAGPLRLKTQRATVDIGPIPYEKIVRFTVNFESLGTFNTRTKVLKKAGLIDEQTPVPASMSIGLFDVVVRALADPEELILYVHRRNRFVDSAEFLADELDLLTFYQKTQMIYTDKELGEALFMLYGDSNDLDEKLAWSTSPMQPISVNRSSFIMRILHEIEQRKPIDSVTAKLCLIALAPEKARHLERLIRKSVAGKRDSATSGGVLAHAGNLTLGIEYEILHSDGAELTVALGEDSAHFVTRLGYNHRVVARPAEIAVLSPN